MEITSQRNTCEELEAKRNDIDQNIKLNLYEEYLKGLTADPSINTAEVEHLRRYREQRKITEEEHKKVIQKLGYDEQSFDKLKSFVDTTTNDDECIVCFNPPKDQMIIPCNHICLCPNCVNEYYTQPYDDKVCPLCEKSIQDIKQVFYF